MATLSAFLNPVPVETHHEVVISDRFRNEDGTVQPFVIRALMQEENDRLVKSCTRQAIVNGQQVSQLDKVLYSRKLILAATVVPDFSESDLCQRYGVLDPNLVPGKMLTSGEYSRLATEISQLSGFQSPGEVGEEAKN